MRCLSESDVVVVGLDRYANVARLGTWYVCGSLRDGAWSGVFGGDESGLVDMCCYGRLGGKVVWWKNEGMLILFFGQHVG